ncbi:caldesmon isoform X4, partial [Sigmodon hispidus]
GLEGVNVKADDLETEFSSIKQLRRQLDTLRHLPTWEEAPQISLPIAHYSSHNFWDPDSISRIGQPQVNTNIPLTFGENISQTELWVHADAPRNLERMNDSATPSQGLSSLLKSSMTETPSSDLFQGVHKARHSLEKYVLTSIITKGHPDISPPWRKMKILTRAMGKCSESVRNHWKAGGSQIKDEKIKKDKEPKEEVKSFLDRKKGFTEVKAQNGEFMTHKLKQTENAFRETRSLCPAKDLTRQHSSHCLKDPYKALTTTFYKPFLIILKSKTVGHTRLNQITVLYHRTLRELYCLLGLDTHTTELKASCVLHGQKPDRTDLSGSYFHILSDA